MRTTYSSRKTAPTNTNIVEAIPIEYAIVREIYRNDVSTPFGYGLVTYKNE
ncbi:hypothetical protein ACFSTE_17890 [Aquimarina hainanensis]|uniref:Uncharacterized protein n=1 Tax=Aquimarina hainanensis TaxID=1578017 RepID=A0ABW5NDR3_9FLAO|nr:hypothetical protein [Aquimarina sp. TRL1]QKX06791.1 hypothetical protein HN014_18335 [Aquimarina sp. TRL1]